jgi:hypothetical protein
MLFPPLAQLGKAALIAVILAATGYFTTPASGWLGNAPADAALLLGLGALLGGWLSGLSLSPGVSGSDDGTQTLFVGNLAFKASEEELRELFAPFGQVQSARIMRDRKTRRPRGYGFVEMSTPEARKAIKSLDGKEFHGRKLRVKAGNRKDVENGGE